MVEKAAQTFNDEISSVAETGQIVTYLEVVEIDPLRKRREEVLFSSFSKRERDEYAGRSMQSLAGAVALKRAVLCYLGDEAHSPALSERDIELGHSEKGAPRIVTLSGLPAKQAAKTIDRLHISVSHTRTQAYGLVVVQETECYV